MAQFPFQISCQRSSTIVAGLVYANLASHAMIMGIPYDSEELAFRRSHHGIMTASPYKTSAEEAV